MIAIIDYGAGNTMSVMNALDRLGVEYVLTDKAGTISEASKVILPGVGHAGQAMKALRKRNLDEVIRKVKQPFLGICIGMQLLFESSEEGNTPCLGILEGQVKKFSDHRFNVPLVGWKTFDLQDHILFQDLPSKPWFYSVHSYYVEVGKHTIASGDYDVEYSAVVQKDNFFGMQFHPEKSSADGNIILKNFIKL